MSPSNLHARVAARRTVHSAWDAAPRAPMLRHSVQQCLPEFRTGRAPSPVHARALATSSAPKGEPCVGRCALLVRRAKTDDGAARDKRGRGSAFAAAIARRISAGSWPSQLSTCQPVCRIARSHLRWSTGSVAPSMVILLSSHSTIRRPRLQMRQPGQWLRG